MFTKPSTILSLLAAGVVSMPALAANNQAQIPAKAISSDTSLVGYVNLDSMTPDALVATAHTFTAAIPDSAKSIRQELDAQIDAGVAKMKKTRSSFVNAGAHAMLFVMSAAKPGEDPQHFNLVQGDSTTTVSKLRDAIKQSASYYTVGKTPPKVSRFTGNWFALQGQGENFPANGSDNQAAEKFQSVLNHAGQAPIRFAFIMNPKANQELAAMQAQPSPMTAFSGPLQSLDNATLTIMPGKAPALDIRMNFVDAQSAQKAATLLTGMLTMGKTQIAAQLTQGPNALSPKLIDDLFKSLQPTVNGKQLRIGLHTRFIQNIAKVVPVVMPMIQQMQQMGGMPQSQGGGGFGPPQHMPQHP